VSAGHGQHVADVPLLQRGAQFRVVVIDLVPGHPRVGDPAIQGRVDHALGQCGFRGEPDVGGDTARRAGARVVGPGFRQVQGPVDQRVPPRRGVGQIHRELGVLDAAGGAGLLALHPDRRSALLHIPGLVDDQDAARSPEGLDHVPTQVITHRIGILRRTRQQVLQPIRRQITSLLGDRPAILPTPDLHRHAERAIYGYDTSGPDLAHMAGAEVAIPGLPYAVCLWSYPSHCAG